MKGSPDMAGSLSTSRPSWLGTCGCAITSAFFVGARCEAGAPLGLGISRMAQTMAVFEPRTLRTVSRAVRWEPAAPAGEWGGGAAGFNGSFQRGCAAAALGIRETLTSNSEIAPMNINGRRPTLLVLLRRARIRSGRARGIETGDLGRVMGAEAGRRFAAAGGACRRRWGNRLRQAGAAESKAASTMTSGRPQTGGRTPHS
jgi:hypothetical protein